MKRQNLAAVVLWMEAGNTALHAGMAVRERRYNPGVVTGVALMGVHAAASAREVTNSLMRPAWICGCTIA